MYLASAACARLGVKTPAHVLRGQVRRKCPGLMRNLLGFEPFEAKDLPLCVSLFYARKIK